mgnify:FL=1
MTAYFSNYLNLVRFAAAIVVLLSHFAYPRFTDGSYVLIRDLNLGSDAVVVFFVLSGLVIAYSAEVKDKTASQYVFNRLTRLYSVAAPAVILTFILDQFGSTLSPAAYDNQFYNDIPFSEMLVTGLSFTGEWGLIGSRLGTNGPYWSLSYEFAYYLAFAAACYTKGISRILLMILLLIVTGPRVWMLAPIWLMGCGVYYLIKNKHCLSPPVANLCIFIPPLTYLTCLLSSLPPLLGEFTQNYFGATFAIYYLRFSDEFIWSNFIGLLTAIHFLGISSVTNRKPKVQNLLTWLSGATFSIYIIHYPLLQFFDAVFDEIPMSPGKDITLLTLTLIGCFIFAGLFERSLTKYRSLLKNIFPTVANPIR